MGIAHCARAIKPPKIAGVIAPAFLLFMGAVVLSSSMTITPRFLNGVNSDGGKDHNPPLRRFRFQPGAEGVRCRFRPECSTSTGALNRSRNRMMVCGVRPISGTSACCSARAPRFPARSDRLLSCRNRARPVAGRKMAGGTVDRHGGGLLWCSGAGDPAETEKRSCQSPKRAGASLLLLSLFLRPVARFR